MDIYVRQMHGWEKKDNDYLCHYGVKGMKWGVRKQAETVGKKAGAIADNVKRVTPNNSSLANRSMSSGDIFSKVVTPVNPTGDRHNCGYCAIAFEMRRRGFDVVAKGDASSWSLDDYSKKTNAYPKNITDAQKRTMSVNSVVDHASIDECMVDYGFSDEFAEMEELAELMKRGELSEEEFYAKVKEFYAKVRDKSIEVTSDKLFESLSKEPDRSRGMINILVGSNNGGHVMSYEIIDNKPIIYDSQNNKMYDSPEKACEYFSDMENNFITNAGYTRLDNVDLDYSQVYDWVERK